jgi:hypothetical protein
MYMLSEGTRTHVWLFGKQDPLVEERLLAIEWVRSVEWDDYCQGYRIVVYPHIINPQIELAKWLADLNVECL